MSEQGGIVSEHDGPAGTEGYLLDNRQSEAGERFAALSELFDAWTFRRLERLGVGPGRRCWEVGAGGPGVTRWLAERVGADGRVLATDIDVSWAGPSVPPVEVRRHDVAADPPPGAGRPDRGSLEAPVRHDERRHRWPWPPVTPSGSCSCRSWDRGYGMGTPPKTSR